MSTAATTLRCSVASSSAKRRPGTRKQTVSTVGFPSLPSEVVEKIVRYMVASRSTLGIVLLSMTSRQCRQEIGSDLHAWYRMYMYWRGPLRQPRTYRTQRGMVTLQPTFPHTLPNFRLKTVPLTYVPAPCCV